MRHYIMDVLRIISAIFLVCTSAGCGKDVQAIYQDTTMAFVTGESSISTDSGLTYNILSSNKDMKLEFGTRIYAVCSVEECIDEAEKTFNVRLLNYTVPMCEAPLDATAGEFDSSVWKDAVAVNEAWISGGYLNILCTWIGHRGSSIEQKTALVYDGTVADTVSFSLVHNSEGEGFYEDSADKTDFVTIKKMATFPVQKYLPSRNVVIRLDWIWHKSDGTYIYPETEPQSEKYYFSGAAAAASAEPSTKATISPLTTLLP